MANTAVEAAIECQGLTRHYGKVKAVEDLDLRVPYGSVFGFLGRNGAGKTTTIRMVTGLAHPTRGRAWVAGIETTSADSSARRMFGYLPQSPAFYNWMTPVEYLDYSARLFDLSPSQARQRISEVLEVVGLKDASRRRIGGFSGGMLQRMGIAQALVHSPPVLLLDEPTSALDPAGRYEVLDLIARLRGQVTVFLSSHILADIERVCDTVAIIREGRLALVAGRDELLESYAVDAVELEFEHIPANPAPIPPLFLEALQGQPWVSGIAANGHILRVSVNNTAQARPALLALAAQHELHLTRLEWVRPTLEEIFLKVSG
ncbi:MAG TPA: ABC transporter ATP-binding protein [Anaerolineales bacterium]|nr:ABC transporter ATP-binding protein [Anaerolineales bacterium]